MASFDDSLPILSFGRSVTVSSGSQTSDMVDLQGSSLVGLITPAGLNSTQLTFVSAASSSDTFVALNNSFNSAISVTCSTESKQYGLSPIDFMGVRFLKIVAGSTESDKTFTLCTRSLW